VREHHREPNLLFVGTELGVFFTIDGGATWTPLKSGMPAGVPVWDLAIQERWNDLVVGTHGRGIFILDDLAPLEQLAQAKRAEQAYLFPVRTEIALVLNNSRNSGMGSTGYTGQNPEYGVRLAYLLKDTTGVAKGTFEIVDGSGRVVRELPVAKRAGLFRPLWDLRVGAPLTGAVDTTASGRAGGAGAGAGGGFGGGFGARGPATFPALPGSYTARLTLSKVNGAPTVLAQRFTILPDPEHPLGAGDLRALEAFRLQVVAFQKRVTDAQAQIDSVVRSYSASKKAADSAGTKATPALKEQLVAVEKALGELVREVGASPASRAALGRAVQAPADGDEGGSAGAGEATFSTRAGSLGGVLNAQFAVSSYQRALLAELGKALTGHLATLRTVRTGQLAKAVSDLKAAGALPNP
jgi:hypothetical protein